MPVLEIPSVGRVQFPDGMSREEMDKAAGELYDKAQGKQSEQPASDEPQVGRFKTFLQHAAAGVGPGAAFVAAAPTGAEIGAGIGSFAGPLGTAIGSGVGGVIAGGGAAILAAKGQQKLAEKVAPTFAKKFESELAAGEQQHPVYAIGGDIASMGASAKTAPFKLATLPFRLGAGATVGAVAPVITEQRAPTAKDLISGAATGALYGEGRFNLLPRSMRAAAAATKGAPDASSIRPTTEVHGDLRPQPEQGAGQVPEQESGAGVQPQGQAQAQGAVQPSLRVGGFPKITAAAVRFRRSPDAPQTVETGANHPEILERMGVAEDAFPTRESRNTEAFGFVDERGTFLTREQAARRAAQTGQQLEPFETSPKTGTLQPHSDEIASPAEPSKPIGDVRTLSKEEQDYLDNERQSIDVPVQVVEGPLTGNNPFARRQADIATIDRVNNRVLLNPEQFKDWLSRIPENNRPAAVRALLSEERIHLAADDASADSYWKSLSGVEQAIERRRYTGKWGGLEGVNDTALGHEALRFRLQQLARMTPREIAEASGAGKWGLQAITTLGNVVRNIRETLGTKASKEGLAILDRIQGNLGTALAVAQGATTPAALNKRAKARPEEREASLYLPPMEKGAKRPSSEELGVSKYVTKRTLDPRDIAFDEARGTGFRPITPSEAKSPSELSQILTQDSRTGGSQRLESETHRLTALYDRYTGRVEVVSTYPHQRRGAMLASPGKVEAGYERVHEPLGAILQRYTPLYSIYRREPVKGFHERYESMADFQKEFGIPAKELASRSVKAGPGETAAVTPEEVPLEQRHDLAIEPPREEAPSESDLRVLHRSLGEQLPKSEAGLKQLLERKGATLPRQAVGAIGQMMEREMSRDPEISPETAMERALTSLYEDIKTSGKDRAAFTSKALGRFASEASGKVLESEAQSAQVVGTPSQTKRVLTMPIERRPPTDVRPENVPQGAIPARQPATQASQVLPGAGKLSAAEQEALTQRLREKYPRAQEMEVESGVVQRMRREGRSQADIESYKEAGKFELFKPPVPDGGIPGASSAPAAINKHFRQVRDGTLAEGERLKASIGALVTRKENFDKLPATYDAAQNIGNNIGREAEWAMRIASNATSTKGMSNWEALKSKLSGKVNPFGRREVLEGVIPVTESGAVKTDYDMQQVSPAGRKLFADLLRADQRIVQARRMIARGNPASVAAANILIEKAKTDAYGKLISQGFIRATNARYRFDDSAINALPQLNAMLQQGIRRAEAATRSGNAAERYQARKDLGKFQKMADSITWVQSNWRDPDLRAAAVQFRKEMDFRYQREADNGYNLRYDENYTPGRYEGDSFNDGKIFFPGVTVLGKQWRSPKTFNGYYEAAGAGYAPATLDSASIAGHRARQGERAIQYKMWTEGLKAISDPNTGLPVSVPLVQKGGKYVVPSQDYTQMTLRTGYEPVGILKPYEPLVKALTTESAFDSFAPARILLELEQRLKHSILLGDIFHFFRLGYYGQAIAGLKRTAGYQGGLSVLDYREADLPRAVRQGLVSQSAADWASASVPVRTKTPYGTRATAMTRREIAQRFQEQGLNVGQIQDALYKDLVGDVPIIGKWNKFLFDKYTRGLMMESAVHEFERLNQARPDVEHQVLMRDIAKDMNRFFGNIGSQGWFKSRTWRDIARMTFLAPQWVEGLISKETIAPKRIIGAGLSAVGLPGGRKGLPALGTLGKGIASGAVTMLAITQAINLLTRGRPTWMNPEEDHKFDAFVPSISGGRGFFFSPLSVFNELTHDLVRLNQTKPKAWDAISQIGQNKLSPFGHAAVILLTGKSPSGEYQTTTGGTFRKAAEQILPTPISAGRFVREGAHAIAPKLVAPNAPGAAQRQFTQLFGLKMEPAAGPAQRMSRLAQQFVAARGGAQSGYRFEPTDDPSYAKLRSAIRAGDTAGASRVLNQLRAGGRTETQIGKAMKMWNNRPWTGSKKAERDFLQSLDESQRRLYWQGQEEKQQTYEAFLNLLLNSR